MRTPVTLRACPRCGGSVERGGRAVYCSDRCRKADHKLRARDVTTPPSDVAVTVGPLLPVVAVTVADAGLGDAPLGRHALALAARLDALPLRESPSAVAALSKELRAVLADLEAAARPVEANPLQRMRARYIAGRLADAEHNDTTTEGD
jgi:hypothetical protein